MASQYSQEDQVTSVSRIEAGDRSASDSNRSTNSLQSQSAAAHISDPSSAPVSIENLEDHRVSVDQILARKSLTSEGRPSSTGSTLSSTKTIVPKDVCGTEEAPSDTSLDRDIFLNPIPLTMASTSYQQALPGDEGRVHQEEMAMNGSLPHNGESESGDKNGQEAWASGSVSDAGMGFAFSTGEGSSFDDDEQHEQQRQQQQQQQLHQQQQQPQHQPITYQPAMSAHEASLRGAQPSSNNVEPSIATAAATAGLQNTASKPSRQAGAADQRGAMLPPNSQASALSEETRRRRKESQQARGVREVQSSKSLMPSQRRIYGLDRDLSAPSADSAHLPPSSGGIRYTASSSSSHRRPFGGDTLDSEPDIRRTSTSSDSIDTTDWRRSANFAGQGAMPNQGTPIMPNGRHTPSPSIALPFEVGVDSSSGPSSSQMPPSPLSPDEGPKFSVEVVAPAFDRRGYPVFTGRGARISGMVRIKAVERCQLSIKLSAYVSQGTAAAVWDGVALMPPEQGGERSVFEIQERLIPDYSKAQLSPARSSMPTPGDDDYIVPVPFEINLPIGMATKYVDGEMRNVPVALPPSFEISSEGDLREKEANRAMSSSSSFMPKSSASSIRSKSSRMTMGNKVQTVGNKVRGAVERGFAEVFRIGCFYTLTFTILRPDDASASGKKKKTKKLSSSTSSSSKKSAQQNDSITIPFIFLGEPTMLPPPPPSVPMSMVAPVLLQPEALLGDQWMCERAQTKWTGNMFRSSKRSVELELHMPQPATLHAPGVFPFLIVIRPTDPNLLSAVEGPLHPGVGARQTGAGASSSSSSQAPDSPRSLRGGGGNQFASSNHNSNLSPSPSFGHSPQASLSASTASGRFGPSNLGSAQEDDATSEEAQEMMMTADSPSSPGPANGNDENDGILSRFMRSSLTLGRTPSKSTLNTSGSSTNLSSINNASDPMHSPTSASIQTRRSRTSLASAFRRRPNTAPTSSSDSRSPPGTVIYRAGMPHNLAELVRVSLLQSTHCVASGPSEAPKRRRKLISVADLEEVDVATVFTGGSHREAAALGRGDVASDEATQAVVAHVKSHGIRVLRGLIRVSRDTTPSFRCQGIEVKYAIKIDLLAFSPEQLKQQKRPASGGSSSAGSGGSSTLIGDAFRGTFGTASRNSLSSTFGRGKSTQQQQQQYPNSDPASQQQQGGTGLPVGAESPLVLPRPMGMVQPSQPQRPSSNPSEASFSPPMPLVPPEHQQQMPASPLQHRSQMPSLSSTIRGPPRDYDSVAPTEVGGHDNAGRLMGPNTFFKATTGLGGGTTVFGGDGKEVRLDKGIGALWADVRVVRATFA